MVEATEGLENEQSSFSNPSVASSTSQLILKLFRCVTYVTAHSPSLPSLLLHHSSFSNPSVAPSTSQALHQRHLESRPCSKTILSWYKTMNWQGIHCRWMHRLHSQPYTGSGLLPIVKLLYFLPSTSSLSLLATF